MNMYLKANGYKKKRKNQYESGAQLNKKVITQYF